MEKDKMHTGELYLPGDPQIMEEQMKCLEKKIKCTPANSIFPATPKLWKNR